MSAMKIENLFNAILFFLIVTSRNTLDYYYLGDSTRKTIRNIPK